MTVDELPFRVRDVVLAGASLLVATPALGAIALAVRLDSPGPVLFRQVRLGQGQRPFEILKFRTMVDRDLTREDYVREGGLRGEDDPRITRMGRLLRRTSLDELPQLINVLRGDMSLVGPRPCVPEQLLAIPDALMERFDVPPGLTGLAQVSGRLRLNWLEKLELDCRYARERSFLGDLALMARTLTALVETEEVYGRVEDNWRSYILPEKLQEHAAGAGE